jgi:type I restriction enzyme S subunit
VLQQFFYDALGETAYADRPRKKLPHGWSLVPTQQLLDQEPKNGVSPEASSQPPGIPTFSIAAIRDGRVDLSAKEHLKYARVDERVVQRYRITKGDILIVRGNANPDLVGKAGMVGRFPDKCIYPDITKRVVFRTAGDSKVSPEFAVLAWNHELVHNQVLRRAKTSNGTLKINSRDVNQIVMPVPPDGDQTQLVMRAFAVDDQIDALVAVGKAYQQLKQSLMHDFLTGRVRVTNTIKKAA